MKKLLLIATGGTIASRNMGEGLQPKITGEELLSYVKDAENFCDVDTVVPFMVDSTNICARHWIQLVQIIEEHYEQYDGFVLCHGTDTMAYSAAALSYMLQNLGKPVVFTGSQLPIEAEGTDAINNLSDAIYFACENICGVYVVFNGIAIIGTHAMKIKTRSFDAFESVNCPDIATIKKDIIEYTAKGKSIVKKEAAQNLYGSKGFIAKINLCTDVMPLKMYPGIDGRVFDFIKNNYRGVVIESFGIGGVPDNYNDISTKLRELTEAGTAVAITTQCMYEGIDLSVYEVGQTLAKQGIINCADMTFEASVMKLMWALAEFDNIKDIKAFMEKPYFYDKSY